MSKHDKKKEKNKKDKKAKKARLQKQNDKSLYRPVREYRLKFYLNAQHYVVFDGKRGETHPHTWEFTLVVGVLGHEVTPFSVFERGIDDYLKPFQNKVLNEVAPFDVTLPTLENLVETFADPFSKIIAEAGGRLVRVEGSEGPTRSYILREREVADAAFEREDLEGQEAKIIDEIVEGVVGGE